MHRTLAHVRKSKRKHKIRKTILIMVSDYIIEGRGIKANKSVLYKEKIIIII